MRTFFLKFTWDFYTQSSTVSSFGNTDYLQYFINISKSKKIKNDKRTT